MSTLEQERRELAEAVSIDPHGIDPIPDEGRDSTLLQQFWIWAGANIAPLNWVLGALGIYLGLSVVETIAVVVVGNVVGCALFGLLCVMGHRTGVNQMVLSRSAFGRRGAYLPAAIQFLAAMAWVGVNTWVILDLVLGVLKEIGYTGGTGTKYGIAAFLMVMQAIVAVYGFYLIRTFEKYTVPIIAGIFIAMSVLAWSKSTVAWTHSTAHGSDKFTAMTQLMTAIGIGWGISWFTYSADYSRFIKTKYSAAKVGWVTAAGLFVPTVWLPILGASVASTGKGETDPAKLVSSVFPTGVTILVLILIMHAPVATNILNLYSSSLAALTLGIKAARWKVTTFAGIVGAGVVVVFIEQNNWAVSFDNFMVSIIVWISPWAGITFVEYFLLRRGKVDVRALYDPPERSIYGDVNIAAVASFVIGLVAGWAWEYGLVSSFQGPIAKAINNTDFSWAAGMLVAGGLYYVLAGARVRETTAAAETAA